MVPTSSLSGAKGNTHETETLTYDADVKALYIQITDADVLETVELAKGVYLDIDAEGRAVGCQGRFGVLKRLDSCEMERRKSPTFSVPP